jgi:nickel transport protein
LRALFVAALLSLPALARAHEVLHEVRVGGAVAVKFFESDGDLLAGAPYQVWAPGDPKAPWQEGRTDGRGWMSFVPAEPGPWRIRVVGEDGHGLSVVVDTAPAPAAPAPAPGPGGATFVLRPLLGVLLIGALFGGLVLLYRRRR